MSWFGVVFVGIAEDIKYLSVSLFHSIAQALGRLWVFLKPRLDVLRNKIGSTYCMHPHVYTFSNS